MTDKPQDSVRRFVDGLHLRNDYGKPIPVSGEIIAENMHFNDISGKLTVEKVYRVNGETIAYSAISAKEDQKDRRAYLIEQTDDHCHVSNGNASLDLDPNDLIHLLSLALAEDQAHAFTDADMDHIQRRLAANA